MIGVYRVNYTVIADDHTFNDFFYCRDMSSIKESIQAIMEDYKVLKPYVADGCIYGAGEDYDVSVTVEATSILDDKSLASFI